MGQLTLFTTQAILRGMKALREDWLIIYTLISLLYQIANRQGHTLQFIEAKN